MADATAVVGQEAGAAASALPLAVAGVLLAPAVDQATWTAVYLTTAGVVVTLVSLLREDRRALGWAGGALLAAASWVRLWDLGVHAPEAYTLPSAVALLAVGLLRLRRDPSTTTMTALAPGLGLALRADPAVDADRAGRPPRAAARPGLPAAGAGRRPAGLDRPGSPSARSPVRVLVVGSRRRTSGRRCRGGC